jgi:peptidoglycan hydrolase-like protein with peptidoglycan-binding domain
MGHRLAAGLAVLLAVAVVIAIVLAVRSPSPTSGATNHNPAPGTTTVQRRNLVETDTESGTLSYANPQTVYDRLSGTITWLPSVGRVIRPGQALYRVDGAPVILMSGTTPAYRDLSGADSRGEDILELNRDLIALGFNPEGIVADDVWQAATTAAVEVFQESLGEPPTGVISLGQIVFLPGDQVVSAVDSTLGSDGGATGGQAGSASADTSPASRAVQFVSLTTATTPQRFGKRKAPHTRQSAKTIAALIALLKAESAQLKAEAAELAKQRSSGKPGASSKAPKGPGSGSKAGAGGPASANSSSGAPAAGSGAPAGGSGGGNATAILQTSSTQVIATVDLDASKQSEAKVGETVTVEMPAGNTVEGRITAVSPVAQSSTNAGSGNNGGGGSGGGPGSGNGSSSATIPVTIELSRHLSGAGLDQAAVSVGFDQAKADNVLSVPVTALLATPGGGYAVQAATSPHKLVPVTTGLFAAGYVQISGPGVYPGLEVTDSQG